MASAKLILNQAIAIEKDVKTRAYNEVTELHKQTQKAELVNGFVKTYAPLAEDGTKYPDEKKLVQVNIGDVFKRIAKVSGEWYDISATRDFGNCNARADVIVDGVVLIQHAPVTFLLFMEKQLSDLKAFIGKLSELDQAHTWNADSATGLWKSGELKQHRTEKIQETKIVVQATKEFPAQTKDYVQDKLVGYWTAHLLSGGVQPIRKRELLDRVEALVVAVKSARERANMIEVERINVGAPIFEYLFK